MSTFTHCAVETRSARGSRCTSCTKRQTVQVGGESISFERGEAIVTEHCYKHPRAVLAAMLATAGWRVLRIDADPRARMHL